MHEQTDQAKIMGHSSRVPSPIRFSSMIIQKQNSEFLKNACFWKLCFFYSQACHFSIEEAMASWNSHFSKFMDNPLSVIVYV